ncbi:hypothetical protein KR018_001574 [Drosophila ironensis]|nr:hypothetical protein KR018_001574 [Drosophila ironensis]
MFLPARLALLGLLLVSTLAQGQKSKSSDNRPQGRTLGLLTPLLLGAGVPLLDAPVPVGPPIRPSGGSSSAAAGAQSDPLDNYYGQGGYGSNYGSGYPNYYGYRPSYGYRPNYYGYGYPSYGYNYGYPSYNGYNRPSYNYNYGGYQRPQSYPGNYYRPNYSSAGVGSYGGNPATGLYGSAAAISSSPGSPGVGLGSGAGLGTGAGAGGGSQLSQAQAAQLAGLLGQALGSSLRPYLANGGAGAAAGGAGAGANPQALSGLLGLLG